MLAGLKLFLDVGAVDRVERDLRIARVTAAQNNKSSGEMELLFATLEVRLWRHSRHRVLSFELGGGLHGVSIYGGFELQVAAD